MLFNCMPENEISKVKTKLRNTCEKYFHVKVPYKQKKIISNLLNRTEKCMPLLSSNQFKHISNDPTKSLETKVQQTIQKIKSKLSE